MRVFLLVVVVALLVSALDVRDWNDRPLREATVAVYDADGSLVALSYVVEGRTVYGLPWGGGFTLRVAWGLATLGELLSGRVIWIYDSQVARDVAELGAPASGKIRTWAYPLTIVVRDREGRPVAGCAAKVVDVLTGGRWFYLFSMTGSDGSVSLYQAPAADYHVSIFCNGVLSAGGKFSIQRGAPSTAWNVEMTVNFIDSVRVVNAP
ncbi:MAG: hypothetical protein ABWK05_00290 [Pyrobaculum sp.]